MAAILGANRQGNQQGQQGQQGQQAVQAAGQPQVAVNPNVLNLLTQIEGDGLIGQLIAGTTNPPMTTPTHTPLSFSSLAAPIDLGSSYGVKQYSKAIAPLYATGEEKFNLEPHRLLGFMESQELSPMVGPASSRSTTLQQVKSTTSWSCMDRSQSKTSVLVRQPT